jgi:hypothetical protein
VVRLRVHAATLVMTCVALYASAARAQSAEQPQPPEARNETTSQTAEVSAPDVAPPPSQPANPEATPPEAQPANTEPGSTQAGAAGSVTTGTLQATAAVPTEAKQTASADEAESEPEKPTVPWSASFSWTQAYTAAGLAQGGQQTWNPTYAWYFTLALGYELAKDTVLSAVQPATIELTDSDTTHTRQELWFFDTTVDLSHKLHYELDSKRALLFMGAAGVILPTAKDSRAAAMVVGPKASLGAGYSDKNVLHELTLSAGLSYARRFTIANVAAVQHAFPCEQVGTALSHDCSAMGESSTKRDWFVLDLGANLALSEKWTLGASLSLWWYLARSLAPADLMLDTGTIRVADMSVTHWRNTRWLVFSVGYKITDWLTASARMINAFSELGPNGRPRSLLRPFDTLLGLGLSVSFDQLYLSTRAHAPSGR